jgi:heat shock protein HtpX
MLAVNLGIIFTLSIVMQLLGITPRLAANGLDYANLFTICLVWGMGGALISLLLSKPIAKMSMRVRIIPPNTTDAGARKIYDIVRRAAERARLPKTPEVGVYESPELNAFATGATRSRAMVAVSTGLLNHMNDAEVEGVIGHEVTHIANGDMVTMTLLQGVMNAMIMFVARILAYAISNAGARDGERRTGGMGQFMLVILLQNVLGIFGMMVVAWFSRRREYRADAGGARVAGRDKMISALQALQNRSRVLDTRAPQFSAFKISGKSLGGFAALLTTHPPLEARIEALQRATFSDTSF